MSFPQSCLNEYFVSVWPTLRLSLVRSFLPSPKQQEQTIRFLLINVMLIKIYPNDDERTRLLSFVAPFPQFSANNIIAQSVCFLSLCRPGSVVTLSSYPVPIVCALLLWASAHCSSPLIVTGEISEDNSLVRVSWDLVIYIPTHKRMGTVSG